MHLSEKFLDETTKLVFHLQISLAQTQQNASIKKQLIFTVREY